MNNENNLPKGSVRLKGKKYEASFYNPFMKKHEYIRESSKELAYMTLKQLIYYTFKEDTKMVEKIKNENIERNKKKTVTNRESIAYKKFEDVFMFWLNEINTASKNTKEDYEGILNNHLSKLKNKTFNKVTDFDIQEIYNNIKKEKGDTFLYRIHKCVASFYNAMYKKKIITTNYMDFLDVPYKPKVKHITFKEDEYKHIIDLLKNNTDPKTFYLYGLAILCSGCGLRAGEALGLTLDYTFLDEDYIKVEQQITFEKGKGYYLSNELKTEKSHRNVVLIPSVKSELIYYLAVRKKYLEKIKMINKEYQDNKFIIINELGNFVPTNTAERHWREFKKNNNINKNFRIHDLRRYFAKKLLKNKIPELIAKKALGHDNIEMTEYYQDDDDLEISKQFLTAIE